MKMKSKKNLRKFALGFLTAIFAVCCGVGANVAPSAEAVAEEAAASSPITWLYTPNATDLETGVASMDYTTKWNATLAVEEYSDSPTGNVLHNTIDHNEISSGQWVALKVKIPYEGTLTETEKTNGGYIMWVEYTAEMYTDNSSAYGLFAQDFGSNSYAFKSLSGKPFTWVNAYGKITSSVPKRSLYHHENYTAIEGTEYTYAYTYSYKGYVLMPFSTLHSSDYIPGAVPGVDRIMRFQQTNSKDIEMDLKIGGIGFYTDYNATVNDLGRCSYEFVGYDGEVVKSGLAKAGEQLVTPEKPEPFTKDGKVYTFVGWAGYTEGMTITSDKTFNAVYKVSDFHMVQGASIRTNAGSSGIRFAAEFDEDLYNEVSLSDNKEFGMIITKLDYYTNALKYDKDLVAGLDSLGNNKYVLITESTKNPLIVYPHVEETTRSYRINGAITNIQYSHADWKWIGVGVVITTDENGEKSYLYCAHDTDNARTASYVASSALNNPNEKFTSTQKDTIKSYVYKTAAIQAGKTEAEYNATEDKASYLANYSLSIGEGLELSEKKFNEKVAGDEAYLEIGYTKDLETVVSDKNGNVLDIACTIATSDPSVVSVNGSTIKVEKNGYSALSINCELFGVSQYINVYTGSEDAGTKSNAIMGTNEGATKEQKNANGEIAGKKYDYYQYSVGTGVHLFSAYPDMSVYYIDYLISQGYQYLRIPFYFDTTRYAEIGGTAETVGTKPYFTIWSAKQFRDDGVGDGKGINVHVPANEWCYYDMDLNHYRWNFSLADGSGVNEYGIKVLHGSNYQFMTMKFACAYAFVYTSDMTFIKESTLNVNVNNNEISFGENLTLSDIYTIDENIGVNYKVDGKEMDTMTALFVNHNVEINANLYTAVIGDGNYTIGSSASWDPKYKQFTIEKTMNVKDGVGVEGTTLVDVKTVTGDMIQLSDFTGSAILANAGFDVTQTYVKRYSDGETQTTNEIEKAERGIYNVSVSATNGTQTVAYDVTLDFYHSDEPVEYESFGHTDSSYAVKAYYAIRDTESEWLRGQFKSYDYVSSTYVTGNQISNIDVYGMDLDFATYFSTMKYGDDGTKDTNSTYTRFLKEVYSYDTTTGAATYTDEDVKKINYLALDGNLIQLDKPMKNADGTVKEFSRYAIDSCIYIYVLPRHTKDYYEEFSSSERMKMAYAEPMTSGSVVANFLTGLSGDVSAPTVTQTSKQNYSANWQPSLMWNYDKSDVNKGTAGPQSMTVETIATYYDSFANMSFPFVSWNRPGGRGASSLSNSLLKLGALIF